MIGQLEQNNHLSKILLISCIKNTSYKICKVDKNIYKLTLQLIEGVFDYLILLSSGSHSEIGGSGKRTGWLSTVISMALLHRNIQHFSSQEILKINYVRF